AGLAVIRLVETRLLALDARTQAEDRLDGVGDDGRRADREDQREADGLELLEPQRLADDAREVRVEVRVRVGRREDAGHEGAEGAADAVDAEGVERVVVLEDRLELRAREVGDDAGEDADDDGAGRRDEAGGRRDDDEARDDARAEAEDR